MDKQTIGCRLDDAECELEIERMTSDLAASARNNFAFLLSAGFVEVESGPTLVRFQRNEIEVRIYKGRMSYEIGCEIIDGGETYYLSEFIRLADPEKADRYRQLTATTPKQTEAAVSNVSELFLQYVEGALSNPTETFLLLRKLRKKWSHDYAQEVLATIYRPKANEAFRSGRYGDAVKLYEEFEANLSPSEKAKLSYAKKNDRGNV